MVTSAPERVIALRLFNPVPVMPIVEVATSLRSSVAVVDRVRAFPEVLLGKQAVPSRDGGLRAYVLLVPYLLSAIRMLELASPRPKTPAMGCDLAARIRSGPLQLSDLIGLDTVAAIADARCAEFKDRGTPAPSLLRRMEALDGWAVRRARVSTTRLSRSRSAARCRYEGWPHAVGRERRAPSEESRPKLDDLQLIPVLAAASIALT